jgi:hypothetical protein
MTRLADIPGLADLDIHLTEGDIVTDAVVVSALSNVEHGVRLSIQSLPGTSGITAIGLLVAASDVERADIEDAVGEE